MQRVLLSAALVAVAQAALHCVDLVPTPFCEDPQTARTTMPAKVCSSANVPVTAAANWDEKQMEITANATCPDHPEKFTKEMFCQTNFIPCAEGLACPATPKICYSLCVSGGKTGGHTFLAPDQCQTAAATAFCDKRVQAGEVASVEETKKGECVGLSYFNTYYMLGMMAQKPFQPRACRARFPVFNVDMVKFNADMRVTFMKSLAKKLNRIWGYTKNEKPHKWYRPHNIRLRRVQLQKGLVQVYAELKEFCMIKMRTGKPDWTLKYNNDQYCDKISVTPDKVYANLTKLLDSKKPDRGMVIGEFQVKKESKPGFPTYCYTWQPEEKPKVPGWVWALTAVGSMACLLSTLILQHRYRNRASYVRLNEKLRSYV